MKRSTDVFAPLTQWGRVSGRLSRRGFWPFAAVVCAVGLWGLRAGNFWVLCVALLLIWPLLAAAARRLHDTGRSAKWLILAFVPGVNVIVALWLALPPQIRPSIYDRSSDTRTGPILIAVLGVACAILACLATPVYVARAGMKPAVLPGDLVMVWRGGAGGYGRGSCWPARCPWAGDAVPAIGDVVAITTSNGVRTARVAARAGQSVAMDNGRLVIDGTVYPDAPLTPHREAFGPQGPGRLLPRCSNGAVGLGGLCQKTMLAQTLPGGIRHITLNSGSTALDHYGPAVVPPGHVFALSDNRDVGEDSRVTPVAGGLGFVAQSDIIGRAARVIVSAKGSSLWAVWSWRWSRILEKVT